MNRPRFLLLEILQQPDLAETLDIHQWNLLLRQARRSRLDGVLADRLEHATLPEPARRQLIASEIQANSHQRTVCWEIDRLNRTLRSLQIPVLLLKGAAYIAGQLPAGRGRLVSDVDILIDRAHLQAAEQAMIHAGWAPVKLNAYDQRYYRRWMHELPPLRFPGRDIEVDVHHNILPLTGRLHPNAKAMIQDAQPMPALAPMHLPSVADLILHSAAHLFQDGDLAGAIRDIVDLDSLLRHGRTQPGFWDRLIQRAELHQLSRPLTYALRYTHRLMHTPLPESIQHWMKGAFPHAAILAAMDYMVQRALLPSDVDHPIPGADLARFVLYCRSHWLKMPVTLLCRHLARKATRLAWKNDQEDIIR